MRRPTSGKLLALDRNTPDMDTNRFWRVINTDIQLIYFITIITKREADDQKRKIKIIHQLSSFPFPLKSNESNAL